MEQMREKKTKILVADGAKDGLALWKEILADEYEVLQAGDGQRALEFLEEYKDGIALLMLDLDLPVVDGFGVLEEMSRRFPEIRIPVIMIMPVETTEWAKMPDDERITDFIDRTIRPMLLRKRIGNILQLFAKREAMLQYLDEKKHKLKYVDELTGCLNWEGFRMRVKERLEKGPDHIYGIWYTDIRRFRFVNVNFGYEFGNQLLRYVAEVLQESLYEDEILCRVSADCFAAFSRMDNHAENEDRMNRVWDKVNDFLRSAGKDYKVSQCSGAYILQPKDVKDRDVDRMLDYARMAQRSIKSRNDRSIAFYNEEEWKQQQREMHIMSHLKDAIENGEISVWMQPQFDYGSGEMTGAEALCRWKHAELGWISPGEFIPLLEQSGQITELDLFIWETACQYMREWLDKGDVNIVPLAVNVSRIDILKIPAVEEVLWDLLQKYDLDVSLFRLEITESVYMQETDKMINAVKRLHDKGFVVEMDDFGSGFSSLNMLKDVPLDTLKLDLGFVRETEGNVKAGNIVSSIIRMAHSIEMPVIAEGVEQIAQADFLKSVGCTVMQGFYFAKPMPKEQFEVLLRDKKVGRPKKYQKGTTRYMDEIFDCRSDSSYLFNYCIGGAAFICFDGEHLESIMSNEDFFAAIGEKKDKNAPEPGNILSVMDENDKASTIAAIRQAIKTGDSKYEMFIPVQKQWILFRLHYLYQREVYHYFFCQVENVTKEHEKDFAKEEPEGRSER